MNQRNEEFNVMKNFIDIYFEKKKHEFMYMHENNDSAPHLNNFERSCYGFRGKVE